MATTSKTLFHHVCFSLAQPAQQHGSGLFSEHLLTAVNYVGR